MRNPTAELASFLPIFRVFLSTRNLLLTLCAILVTDIALAILLLNRGALEHVAESPVKQFTDASTFLEYLAVDPTKLNSQATTNLVAMGKNNNIDSPNERKALDISPQDWLNNLSGLTSDHTLAIFSDKRLHSARFACIGLGKDLTEFQFINSRGVPFIATQEWFARECSNMVVSSYPSELISNIEYRIGSSTVLVDRTWIAFGLLKPFADPSCTFRITNLGPGTIRLDRPLTSCGCITPKWNDIVELDRGESFDLIVSLAMGGRIAVDQSILLRFCETSSRTDSTARLRLFANARTAAAVTPDRIDFGPVANGSSMTRTIRLRESAAEKCELVSVKCVGMPVTAGPIERRVIGGMREYELTLSFEPIDLPLGEVSGVVHLSLNGNIRNQIDVSLRGRVLNGPLTVSSVSR